MKNIEKTIFEAIYFICKIVFIVFISSLLLRECKAQDKQFVPNGYSIDYSHFYYVVDTVKMTVQARCYYHGKHYANVRFGLNKHFENDIPVYYGKAFTFPYKKGSTVSFTRKNFRKEYKI